MSACLFWPFFWRISATEGEANQMWTSTASILSVVLFNIEAAELTVRYYNEAKVSTKALAFAVETANRTLRQAGVKARWIDCYVEAAACKGDVEAAVVELTIAADIQSEGVGNFAMGISLLPGVYAKVLWNRVNRYAKTFDVPVATVQDWGVTDRGAGLVYSA